MRRLAVLLVSTAVALGATPLLPAQAAVAPGAPIGLGQYAAAGGIGLTWSAPAGDAPVSGYRVFRAADQIADVPAGAAPLTALDPAVAPSSSADYTVVAYGDGGDSAPSASLAATRPASDPTPGSTEAIVVEGINRHVYYDGARVGDTVVLTTGALTGTRFQQPTVSSTLPVVPGPGTWSTGPSGQRHLDVFLDGFNCTDFVGTLTVQEALFDAQLQPLTYAAELAGTCVGYPVTASLRLHSGVPYVAALVAPAPLALQAVVGESSTADVTVTNRGLVPLTVGAPALSGAQAAEFSLGASSCSEPVGPDAACTVSVGFTPVANGSRTGSLDVPLGTATRSVPLAGTGGRVPTAVGTVFIDRALRRNQLRWSAPADLGVPSTVTYRVQKQIGFTGFQTLGTTTALSFVDTDVTVDSQHLYRVVSFNDAGDGQYNEPDRVTGAAWSVLVASEGPGVDSGLYLVTRVAGQRVPFLADATARFTPTVSPDGSKVVYAQATVPGDPESPTDLWVASLSGSPAPVQLTSLAGDEIEPSWSPDGLTLAFTHLSGDTVEVRTMPAAGGASVLRTATGSHPSWLSDSTRLVTEDYGTGLLHVVDAAGRRTAVPGVTDGYVPDVSPDGLKIAYIHDDGVSLPRLAVVAVTGGTPLHLPDTAAWDSPAWAADSRVVYGERTVGADPPRLGAAGWNPDGYSTPGFVSVPGVDVTPVFWQENLVHLTSAPRLTGGTATVTFARPESDPQTTCALDGAEPTVCVQGAYPTGSVTYTGLAAGSHRVVISSSSGYNQAASSVTAHQWTVDRAAPVNTIVAPAVGAVLTPSVTFSYRASDPSGVASYDVRYRKASSNGAYSAYTSPAGWTGTTASTRVLAMTPGYEYCFSMRSRDRVGNVSAFTADRCVSAPLDDRALVASAGWTRPGLSGAYKNTVTTTTRTGTTLTVRAVQTRRITLVVTKCPTCGQVGVYLGSTRLAVIDTRSSTTVKQVRVVLPLLSSVRSGALVLRPVTAGRTVQIDGIAFGRV